jgi:hypothetical protein
LWATYWYNGFVYGTEIARGFDTFGLLPSEHLSANEIEAASEIVLDQFNSQLMSELVAAPSFAVVRASFDQAVRIDALDDMTADKVTKSVDKAEKLVNRGENASAVDLLETAARQLDDSAGQAELKQALLDLAGTLG